MKMHKTIYALLLACCTLPSLAQDPIKKGSIGLGFNVACPQSELKDIEYDDGFEFNMTYLSRKFPYQSEINVQLGARMDFGGMGKKEFEVDLATPVPDKGNYQINNRTYALMAVGRINFGYDKKVTPYVDLLFGHRNYSTNTYITADNPALNPDYETTTVNNRIVFTKRMHYGAGVGVNYKLNENVSIESSIAYTFGDAGAVMPLKDVTQNPGGNEVYFNYTENVRTDILLINAGFQFQLWKRYRTNAPTNTQPNTPTNTRYKDPPTQTSPKTSDPIIKDKPKTEPTKPKKKAPLEIKSDGPKKDGEVGN